MLIKGLMIGFLLILFNKNISSHRFHHGILRDIEYNIKNEVLRELLFKEDPNAGFPDHRRPKYDVNKKHSCEIRDEFKYSDADIEDLLGKLDLMAEFWSTNYNSVIVDGLIGVRASEGSLKSVMENLKPSNKFYKKVGKLYLKVRKAAKKILEFSKQKKDAYTSNFMPFLEHPLLYKRSLRKMDVNLEWKHRIDYEFNETISDSCMEKIFGSHGHKKCTVTPSCLKMETNENTKAYFLTHQAMYFFAGEHSDCHKEINHLLAGYPGRSTRLYDTLAVNMYAEMARTNLKKRWMWDIFSEQGFFCARLGYVDCFRIDWMRKALSWINEQGCINDSGPIDRARRVKRMDQAIGECSQHMTTVAMGYISMHLDFMLNPPHCSLLDK